MSNCPYQLHTNQPAWQACLTGQFLNIKKCDVYVAPHIVYLLSKQSTHTYECSFKRMQLTLVHIYPHEHQQNARTHTYTQHTCTHIHTPTHMHTRTHNTHNTPQAIALAKVIEQDVESSVKEFYLKKYGMEEPKLHREDSELKRARFLTNKGTRSVLQEEWVELGGKGLKEGCWEGKG